MKQQVIIDGACGEGGGQVLRSSLTLAILLQQPVQIRNIRGGRSKPGLLRQHLAAVRAAVAISNGVVSGDDLGSEQITFVPGKVQPGNYHFAIGSAGSTTLLCQTILLPLALAGGVSVVQFEGGTHNGMSPSVDFLRKSYLPVLAAMGLQTKVTLTQHGFYPAGGGKWSIDITPVIQLKPLSLMLNTDADSATDTPLAVIALCSQLPESIGHREIMALTSALPSGPAHSSVLTVPGQGPGNMLIASYRRANLTSQFELAGKVGTSAENIGKRVAGRLRHWLSAQVAVEEYLADQLLLPMAVAGKGSFTTTRPSMHCLTNIDVIHQFGIAKILATQVNDTAWQISVEC